MCDGDQRDNKSRKSGGESGAGKQRFCGKCNKALPDDLPAKCPLCGRPLNYETDCDCKALTYWKKIKPNTIYPCGRPGCNHKTKLFTHVPETRKEVTTDHATDSSTAFRDPESSKTEQCEKVLVAGSARVNVGSSVAIAGSGDASPCDPNPVGGEQPGVCLDEGECPAPGLGTSICDDQSHALLEKSGTDRIAGEEQKSGPSADWGSLGTSRLCLEQGQTADRGEGNPNREAVPIRQEIAADSRRQSARSPIQGLHPQANPAVRAKPREVLPPPPEPQAFVAGLQADVAKRLKGLRRLSPHPTDHRILIAGTSGALAVFFELSGEWVAIPSEPRLASEGYFVAELSSAFVCAEPRRGAIFVEAPTRLTAMPGDRFRVVQKGRVHVE